MHKEMVLKRETIDKALLKMQVKVKSLELVEVPKKTIRYEAKIRGVA